MKISKKTIFAFAMVLCLGIGVTAFAATYKCNLMYNGNKVGYGELIRETTYGTAAAHTNGGIGVKGFVSIIAYNKSGKVLASGSNTASICAVKTISCKTPYKYKGTYAVLRSSDSRPLYTTYLYSYK